MTALVNPIHVAPDTRENFERDGFVKIDGLLTGDAIVSLGQHFDREFASAPEKQKREDDTRLIAEGEFRRFVPYIDALGPEVNGLLSSESFRALLAGSGMTPCIPAQALAFEVEPEQEGLDWHFGFRSFNYVRPEDMAYTLWIPLDPVEVAGQHGGLAVVPERVYSGREETKLFATVCREHKDDASIIGSMMVNLKGFSSLRNTLLAAHSVEYDFSPGDVLLFNRYVFHKSCLLRAGDRPTRRAFVLRIVAGSARLDTELMRSQIELFSRLKLTVATSHGEKLSDLEQGQLISDSESICLLQ